MSNAANPAPLSAPINMDSLDAILLLDFSGSMATEDVVRGSGKLSRLKAMQESTKAFAGELEKHDKDGITIAKFAGKVKLYDGVTSAKVDDVFNENRPMGGTSTDVALKMVADKFLAKREADKEDRPIFVGIFTDGQPDNKLKLAEAIVDITKKIKDRREFGILFIQVGNDADATKFLHTLNNDLESAGAAHDIVAVCQLDDLEDLTTEEIVTMAFTE